MYVSLCTYVCARDLPVSWNRHPCTGSGVSRGVFMCVMYVWMKVLLLFVDLSTLHRIRRRCLYVCMYVLLLGNPAENQASVEVSLCMNVCMNECIIFHMHIHAHICRRRHENCTCVYMCTSIQTNTRNHHQKVILTIKKSSFGAFQDENVIWTDLDRPCHNHMHIHAHICRRLLENCRNLVLWFP